MLETLHLTKIYKTKGGADVKALDDVSIRFPEKGMVFLLGKSGSGKSTLLNVCGGLDSPTSGEIIVKGRSSKRFSQSDFDSYRNTFIGFIFQEYNILNEFSIEDNIALALELQGKPKDKKAIDKLLEDVDLTGYAKRKPNTLSGGQKQRIAIARALIKSPEIIMADEPTGALDSSTGKQVFETLKKLSKDKLVIVVSHDRDFAEQYGDRIIELKDGKVISDVTKTHQQQQTISENISIVGDVLCIKEGTELNQKDFEEIKGFLSNANHDVIIASGEQDVKTFKEVSHIKDNGEKEVFCDSSEMLSKPKIYTEQESEFIRSKLPIKHATKIGVSSLKTKPIRLFFTILLCTVAFIFFGLLSTMTFYDSEATFKQSLKDSTYKLMKLGKVYEINESWYNNGELLDEYSMNMETRFTKEEMEEYAKIYGSDVFGGISVYDEFHIQSPVSDYWSNQVRGYAYLEETNQLRQKITGKYPEKEDEICISAYTADVIYHCKTYNKDTGEIIELTDPMDIIGKKIAIGNHTYTVVGILDSGKISEKYDVIKNGQSENYQLLSNLYYELQDGLHLVAFVTSECLESLAEENMPYYGMDDFSYRRVTATAAIGDEGKYVFPESGNAGYSSYSKKSDSEEVMELVEGKKVPAENEVLVSRKLLYELVLKSYENKQDTKNRELIYETARQLQNNGVEEENKTTNTWEIREFTKQEVEEKIKTLVTALQKENKPLTLAIKFFDDYNEMAFGEVREFTIVGVWKVPGSYDTNRILFADETAEKLWEEQKVNIEYYSEYTTTYKEAAGAIYGTLFLPYDHSEECTQQLWEIYSNNEYGSDGSKNTLTSMLISNLEMVDMMVEELSKVFLYVGIVLAVFAALLLSNFISVSISYKKKEIGILRAVGARSLDVFKIFFSESFVITLICVVLSVIGSIVCCNIVNGILVPMIGASLFVFGIVSFLILIAVALITVVVATFLPVWNAAKKKPVESIRAL